MTPAGVSLRAAERRDLDAVVLGMVALAHEGERVDARRATAPNLEAIVRGQASERWFGQFLPFRPVWVAEHTEHGIVGAIAGTPVAGHPAYVVARTARLEHLWVDPDHRRGGTGRALVARFREAALAAGYARLEVTTLPMDRRAVAFWRSMGFADWMVTLSHEP